MNYTLIPYAAAQWAISKVGCGYSQAKRLYESMFDCSSLVGRSYIAAGKIWKYGGEVPISMYLVYDDEFELLWPSAYAEIGKKLGGTEQILMARQPGDLQFLCTDQLTSRPNRITHVAMVVNEDQIVHARGVKDGVCMNHIATYDGKVCALTRYNPQCTLQIGMCGWRTLSLQKALNRNGADLTEDGEFGEKTAAAVSQYQLRHGLEITGQADNETRFALGLSDVQEDEVPTLLRVTGDQVNLRQGPGTDYSISYTAGKGEIFAVPNVTGWKPVLVGNAIRWISDKYVESV